ncbi:metallophosphoesterase family protein [Terrihabitans rhizophilus]|uniref:Metallophosphoesterase n=1 Tax=Terrihabitans rhizophilus TaxID=3092662 RepID=A0ABU4RW12_9HYPH|nr:metallophosphoesterase [Terrihabitans sp. PJ23]MDX6807061.1 metallophosphoesterase [Terrihabitans sp. PJ23]
MQEDATVIELNPAAAGDTAHEPAAQREAGTVRVAAIGDVHVHETASNPYRDLFTEISDTADVLVLAGDLTDFGKTREAEILAEDLRHCKAPIVAVLGNHDHECGQPEEVKRILRQAGVCFLGENAHIHKGVGFAGVKGFGGGFGRHMLGAFGEAATKAFVAEVQQECMHLEIALRSLRTERKLVVLHYAPIEATVVGEPEQIYPYLGSSRLAEVIDRFDGVSAVVHGHAHRGAHRGETPKGIPVFNVAAGITKEGGRPYAVIEV